MVKSNPEPMVTMVKSNPEPMVKTNGGTNGDNQW
jgi:hypothetical protein